MSFLKRNLKFYVVRYIISSLYGMLMKIFFMGTDIMNYNVNYNKEYILGLCSLFKAALLKQLEFP